MAGRSSQFTYDFGIAIAQSTVNKVAKLAGVSLTLAGAFYALRTESSKYVNTLRQYTLQFGGMLNTARAIEQAQNRLVKGMSHFKMEDQLAGMNKLMAVGVDVGRNLDWINKAAHATGMSYEQFSNMIASSINGNAHALVEAGLMTERSARMFDKYTAGTVQRQQAILNFLKTHKGLNNAMANDFETAKDQVTRLKGIWSSFIQKIAGDPRDPSSLMGSLNTALKRIADMLGDNFGEIKKYAYAIGQVAGWFIRKIGGAVTWVLRKVGNFFKRFLKLGENYKEQVRSFIVYLEFWKVKVVDVIKKVFFNNEGKLRTFFKFVIGALAAVFSIRAIESFVGFIVGSLIPALKALRFAFLALSKINPTTWLLFAGLGALAKIIHDMYTDSKAYRDMLASHVESVTGNPEDDARYAAEAIQAYEENERNRQDKLDEIENSNVIPIGKRLDKAYYNWKYNRSANAQEIYTDADKARLKQLEENKRRVMEEGIYPAEFEQSWNSKTFFQKYSGAFSKRDAYKDAYNAEVKAIRDRARTLYLNYKNTGFSVRETPQSDDTSIFVSNPIGTSNGSSTYSGGDDSAFDTNHIPLKGNTSSIYNDWMKENGDVQNTNVNVSPGAVTINLYEQQNARELVQLINDTVAEQSRSAVMRKGVVSR